MVKCQKQKHTASMLAAFTKVPYNSLADGIVPSLPYVLLAKSRYEDFWYEYNMIFD